jgi:putative ABC transport system permease protein
MLKVTLRSIWEHKRRLVLTITSIVLGVSFLAGTLVLNESFNRLFDDLFATSNENVDTQVRGELLFSDSFGGGDQRALLPADTVDTVASVEGVRAAEPYVQAIGFGSANRVLDADGEPIGSMGPPTLLESWVDGSTLTPYSIAEGRGPSADDEMALNVAAAEDGDLEVGDTVTVATSQFGNKEYELVGTVLFGTAKSSAGAVSAEFTLAEAMRLAGTDGDVQQVVAGAEEGLSQEELTRRIQGELPEGAEAVTGEQAAAELSSDVQEGFQFFTVILVIFGGIALLVGAFVIYNTFQIIVQQRTRELALLRAVGATRRQVLSAVIIEGAVVGLFGALLGLGVGILLAQGFISAIGDDFASGVTVTVRASVIALLLGTGVTLLAALIPAVRATRVPPLAALRDVAIDRSGASKIRIAIGVVVGVAAAYLLARGWTGDGTSAEQPPVFIGAILLVVAAITVGPVLSGPSVRLAGRAVATTGITRKLAVENAARSPKRTSATASALLIGVTLVALLLVFAESAKASIDKEISRGFTGDFVVMSEGGGFAGFSGFSPTIADQVAAVPGVDTVLAQTFAQAEITYDDGATVQQFLTSIDVGAVEGILDVRMEEGRTSDLEDDGILVDVELADAHDVEIGDPIHLLLMGGAELDLTVQGITDDEQVLGYFTITRDTYLANVPDPQDAFVYGAVDEGADVDEVLADIEPIVSETPDLTVEDREGFIGSIAEQITFIVNFISIMLLLSITIALIGVANTLSLSISERIRELGLLRAVGMDKTQLKRSIRWEAVIMSVLGTGIGIFLALVIGRAMMKALEPSGLSIFEVPVGSLVVLLIGGALVGTVAAVFPSRRAARFPVLDAIAQE